MMRFSLYLHRIIYVSIVYLSACAGEGSRFAEDERQRAQRVSWLDVEQIFIAECSGCHDDPPKLGAPQPLRTYEEVTPWLLRIQVRSLDMGDMPPGGLRTEGATRLLTEWINQGAPKTIEDTEDIEDIEDIEAGAEIGGEIPLLDPTWTNSIGQLFEVYCNTCHADPPTGGAPLPFKTYEQAIPYLERFQFRVIEQMDMPPEGISNPIDLQRLQAWIEAGGPR